MRSCCGLCGSRTSTDVDHVEGQLTAACPDDGRVGCHLPHYRPSRGEFQRANVAVSHLNLNQQGTPGNVTLADVKAAEEAGLKLVAETGAYYVNQFNNEANVQAHYEGTGPEIWRQTGGKVDAFVATVGTAGSFVGTSRFLKEKNPNLWAAVVEPAGAEPIKGDPVTKPRHLLQGSGYGCVPNLFTFDTMDESIAVTDQEAVEYKG